MKRHVSGDRHRPKPLRERLPAHPSSVGLARRLVRGAATATGNSLPIDLLDDAELLVSELVSNAILHAGTPVDVEVSVETPTSVLVSVGDGSRRIPSRRHYGSAAATGRGLRLLERVSDEWGVTPRANGKTVWFRVSSPEEDRESRPASAGEVRRRSVPTAVAVELHNVPLQLHARWQQQAEALVREHLLHFADEDDAIAQLEQHAECSEAIALLEAAVAASSTGWAPRDGGDEVWCDRVAMSVPHESVAHFATLDRTLAAALAVADDEQLLSAPTDLDARLFRRWICEQVAGQARGLPPTGWPPRPARLHRTR
jgi:anti-sigma regulatory factor (Ser/Thr protein kinase)